MINLDDAYVVKTGEVYVSDEIGQAYYKLSSHLTESCILTRQKALEIKQLTGGDVYRLKIEREWGLV